MSLFSMIYMGLVCGFLAVWAPSLGRQKIRFIVGVAVGIAAMALLPQIRALLS